MDGRLDVGRANDRGGVEMRGPRSQESWHSEGIGEDTLIAAAAAAAAAAADAAAAALAAAEDAAKQVFVAQEVALLQSPAVWSVSARPSLPASVPSGPHLARAAAAVSQWKGKAVGPRHKR